MKLLLISSAGGHFTELLQLKEVFEKFDHVIVSADREDTHGIADYLVDDPGTNSLNYLKLILTSLSILLKENPDVIITTGAGIAFPMILLGKLLGKKIVFIESICRFEDLSRTGKWVYKLRLYDLFLVQWPELQKKYPKTKYWGQVI